MRVVHINTYPGGGAAKAAIRLHQALLSENVQSSFLSLHAISGVPHSYSFADLISAKGPVSKLMQRSKEYIYSRKVDGILAGHKKKIEVFSLPDSPYDINQSALVRDADIIVLHWVAGFMDYQRFFKNIHKPIIWVMHDMFPFTGGCHYSGPCELYTGTCPVCPLLEGTANPSYTHQAWNSKQQALKRFGKLYIVAPSNWLMECSKRSSLFGAYPHYHIPNSVDEEVFRPMDKTMARKVLNLPVDKKILLFVAENLSNDRKGYGILLDALQQLPRDNDWMLCTMGNATTTDMGDISIQQLGQIKDELLLNLVYAAADVFIIPSLEDNLPNTVVEALMCGIPTIGFQVGGIKELIVDGKNGYLCDEISATGLASKINHFLTSAHGFERETISLQAAHKYASAVQAAQYVALMKGILADSI